VVVAESLLLISLGPVQGFIAAGRRGQDLWGGSQLLSDAAAKIAESFLGVGELVFPGEIKVSGEGEHPSVANKILVVLGEGVEAAAAANEARKALNRFLEDELKRLKAGKRPNLLNIPRAQAQIFGTGPNNGMFELMWAAVPMEGPRETHYASARARVEGLLQARKNTRDWGPVAWNTDAEGQPAHDAKSPIDGERETVVLPSAFEDLERAIEDGNESKRLHEEHRLRRTLGLQRNETLDGPGMLKRLRQVDERFDSDDPVNGPIKAVPRIHGTAHLAAAPLLTRITAEVGEPAHPGAEAIGTYFSELKHLGFDLDGETRIRVDQRFATIGGRQVPRTFQQGDWEGIRGVGHDGILFFEGQLHDIGLKSKTEGKPDPDVVRKARTALRRCLAEVGVSEPCPYYALLLADGDQLGERLRSITQVEDHQAFSIKLEQLFASKCQETIADHGGSLIYSGGDDVLALLPLHTLLDAIKALRVLFKKAMEDALGPDSPPTLSIGVAICHHLDPLVGARALAQRAEKLAKNGPDNAGARNGLALIMDKRSGSTVEIYGHFGESPPLLDRLDEWIELLRSGALPDGVAYELDELTLPFELAGKRREQDEEQEALRALVRRVLVRKRDLEGKVLAGDLIERLMTPVLGEQAVATTQRISREIQVARLLLRALEDAGLKEVKRV
jgi:CRISPR-associated protein Cmr2